METKPMTKYFAELVGTFVLVFIGTGSAVLAGHAIGFIGISFAFGISVLVMVYAIGPISGCHINPAITIAMLVAGKISGKFKITGEIVEIVRADIVYIVSVLSANNLVKVIATEEEVAGLQPGAKVMVASKAFNPVILKME